MPFAKANMLDNKIINYTCSCVECKEKSVTGEGDRSFNTAEELLEHRNTTAFKCPLGCGYHIANWNTSIWNHINVFHSTLFKQLSEQENWSKKMPIYADDENSTYTTKRPDNYVHQYTKRPIKQKVPKTPEVQELPNFAGPTISEMLGRHSPKNESPAEAKVEPENESPAENQVEPENESPAENQVEPEMDDKLYKLASVLLKIKNSEKKIVMLSNEEYSYLGPAIAPFDIYLEDSCKDNMECRHINNPFKCGLNHHNLGPFISKGSVIPVTFCNFERPPYIRCHDLKCKKNHMKGRRNFIEKEYAKQMKERDLSMADLVNILKPKRVYNKGTPNNRCFTPTPPNNIQKEKKNKVKNMCFSDINMDSISDAVCP
jgi:hypothetical protein